MDRENKDVRNPYGTGIEGLRDWLFRYSKIIMPIVLVICVAVTVVIAVNANKRKSAEEETAETTEEKNICL